MAWELFNIGRGFIAMAILGTIAFFGYAAFVFAATVLRRMRKARKAKLRAVRDAPQIAPDEWLKDFG